MVQKLCALIMGAPASGKGTISGRIIKTINMIHISSGDILRQNIQHNTKLGVEVKQFLDEGILVPDNKIIDCISDEIKKNGDNSLLLDGFPRTRPQAEKLWDILKLDCVINLVVPFDVIVSRVQGRWVHLKSGRVYNTDFNAPVVPFKDDLTGEELIQREDDQPKTVLKRLKVYEDMTKPVIDFYKKKGILHDFHGSTSDEIWPKVTEFFKRQNFI